MKSITAARLTAVLAGLALAITGALALTPPAQAATLQPVTGFGSNPGNLDMYLYQPDGLPAGAPVVVALHGCTQDASAYHTHSGWRDYADRWGFNVVYPQQRTANHNLRCFHWYEAGDTTRGQGEALSVKQMVDHTTGAYGGDPDRVFVTGLSAGGAMSAAMLATYPDTFAGGSVVAGLPYRCAPPNSYTICQYIGVSQSPQQWGDLVRQAYPGYQGPAPRVAIWHGTGDYTVTPANATELVKQWTNVAGVPDTPTGSDTLPGGTTLERYGADQVRLYLVDGMGHGLPVDPGPATDQCGQAGAYFLDTICAAYHDAVWFGLAGSAPPPEPTPTATDPGPGPSPTAPPECVTDDNYAHTVAGRAYQAAGQAYAVGSGDHLGLWNVFVTTSLRRTGPDYWELGC